jgi:hypothetical protein
MRNRRQHECELAAQEQCVSRLSVTGMSLKGVDGAGRIAMQQGRCNDQFCVDPVEPLARGMYVAQCSEKSHARRWVAAQHCAVNGSRLRGVFNTGPHRYPPRFAQRVIRISMRARGALDAFVIPMQDPIEQTHSSSVGYARGDRGVV